MDAPDEIAGAGEETPRPPRMPIPDFLIPGKDGVKADFFLPWFHEVHFCDVSPVKRSEVWSRGNNDMAEMLEQAKKTGLTQYQTGTFEVDYTASPFCVCEQGHCSGIVALNVALKITLAGGTIPTEYMLVPGPSPSTPTTPLPNTAKVPPGTVPPGPGATVRIDTIEVPKPQEGNQFVQPAKGKPEFTANATTWFPCTPGTYARRFYVFPVELGGTNVTPGFDNARIVFFIDVNATIKATDKCASEITLETFLMEFHVGFDFSHGGIIALAPQEMVPIQPTSPKDDDLPFSPDTHSIVKRIALDGKKVDKPYPPKAPD